MYSLLKRIEREILNKKVFAWLLIFFVFSMIVPLLYIGQYGHMTADDYWYGFKGYIAWLNTHSVFQVMWAGVRNAVEFWHTWQGTYSSIFMFTCMPGLFGEQYYFIVPYMMIGMTFISNYILFYVLLVRVMKTGLYNFFIFFLMSFFMQIEFIYSPGSALYWYNGAVHYVFMQGFVNIAAACVILYFYCVAGKDDGKKGRVTESVLLVMASVFGFIASGANFSSTLLNIEIYSLFLIAMCYLFFRKRVRRVLYYLIPYAITFGGFLLNVLAPGNSVRQAYFSGMGAAEAIINALIYSFSQAAEWINVFVVLCLLMLVPFILNFASRTDCRFRFAPAVAVISYCLYASMFTPGFYAGGTPPLSRNQNICKVFLLAILVLNDVYLLGWVSKKIGRILTGRVAAHRKGTGKWGWFAYLCLLAAVFVFSFFSLDFVPKKATFISYGAWDVIYTGDGRQYWREYLNRLELYKHSEDRIIYVTPYSVRPYPIWINSDTEVSDREDGQISSGVALWYGKDAIYELSSESQ